MIKKFIYFFIIILLIGIMLISIYFIYKELKQNKEQEDNFEKLIEIVENTNNENNNNDNEKIDLTKLYKLNNDLVGWIKIDNTSINYPIMQSKNNPNYYLKRDFYKKYSTYGTPFLSEQCDIYKSDNNIVYGHNMKNKKMFGELENYKKEIYCNEHQIIELTTLEKISKYQIFVVLKTTAYNNSSFKYYDYIDFQNEEDYKNFINKCKELSFYKTNKTPEYKNRLLTLSTCEYSNENGRLVIVAYEVND